MTVRFQALPLEGMPRGPLSRFAPELIAYHQPDHVISGQYRDLTTSMLVQTLMEQPRVLMFTAGASGVGTTSVMLNTAITLARHNLRRVVVIDAHFKHPAIAARLGLPEAPGLKDVLAGRCEVDSVLRSTPLPGLTAVLAGTDDAASPVRLAGERMRSLLWQLREQYDLVLVDSAPWDGRPEIVALGCACDAVYVCLPEKEEESPETASLLQVIPEQGAPLRGCILTSR
jgi:Mrp family chromosome partitioning ATPase